MIRQIIQMLLVMIVGNSNRPVNDLRKKPTREDHLKTANCIFKKYRFILNAIFFLSIFILFVWVCFTFVGASGVESGSYYNHMVDVI